MILAVLYLGFIWFQNAVADEIAKREGWINTRLFRIILNAVWLVMEILTIIFCF